MPPLEEIAQSAPAGEPPESLPGNGRFGTRQVRFPTQQVRFPVRAITTAQRSGTELRFRVTADVLFDFDRAEIRPQAEGLLRDVARQIRGQSRQPAIRIEGHADGLGSDAYNDALSLRRAESVRAFFAGSAGLPARAMQVQGLGKRNPVAPNTRPDGSDNPEGRQLNRRVEIVARL